MGDRALVVCHAGAGIGLGHLSRSIVVAQALQRRLGMELRLQVHSEPLEHQGLAQFSHRFATGNRSFVEAILEAVADFGPQIVLLDIHQASIAQDLGDCLQALRRAGFKVVAIDGLVRYQAYLDLIYLPSIRQWIELEPGAKVPVVYGWDCLLLPAAPQPSPWQPGHNVLILTGGADATELGQVWPDYLDAELEAHTHLHWVRGPYAKQPALPRRPVLQWTIHHAPQGLKPLMADCHYAVTVFGVTFFELLQHGVPTVVFSPYGRKDDTDLLHIAKAGVALVADDERDAVDKLRELMGDSCRCAQLSAKARAQVQSADGGRISGQVAILCAGHPIRSIS